MILWDTKKRGGRPDTMQLLKDTWKSFGAEVIFITSNMQGNDEMMQGCRQGKCSYLSPIINRRTITTTDKIPFSWLTRLRHSLGLLKSSSPNIAFHLELRFCRVMVVRRHWLAVPNGLMELRGDPGKTWSAGYTWVHKRSTRGHEVMSFRGFQHSSILKSPV
jgi:hypothetical protein